MNKAINKPTLIASYFLFFLFLGSANEIHGSTSGETLFYANCAKCHGKDGEGFLQLYPPISGSPFLGNDIKKLPCIIRYGMRGKIERNGKIYNGIMPKNTRLSDSDIDTLLIYITKRWSNDKESLDTSDWLNKCNE